MLLRKLKIEIEAASSMHQASYPAMLCKEHGTTSYGLNTKHQHFRVIFDKKKPSKEKIVEFVNYMNSLSLADGPLTTDVAKGAAASRGLDANAPEAGLGAMAAAHAGIGASPDGLNMDAAEPDPRKKIRCG